jgi:multiple sugar transport system permease protein
MKKKRTLSNRFSDWMEASAGNVLLLPAILIVLFLSIFPLLVSLYLSFSRLLFVKGGLQISWVGVSNYNKLLFGGEKDHFLGRFAQLSVAGWLMLIICVGAMVLLYVQYATSKRRTVFGLIMRVVVILLGSGLVYIMLATLSEGGLPGTLGVTLIFVFVGVPVQYLIGLGLALLVTQNLPGKRFFRVIFLLPMMITPVGIGFLFRMLADTNKGPIVPIWLMLGLQNFSWADTAGGARAAVLIGDIWQWTPFMFIILLAAVEATSREQVEAALVDGATRFSIFQFIILPQIMPVSTTLILIRMIEAFKILDLPVILTGGGPGTATESLTLYAYNLWRAIDLGSSSAIAYMLLIVVTFCALVYVNSIRRRLIGEL